MFGSILSATHISSLWVTLTFLPRIYVRSDDAHPLLAQGIELIDLPGISDTNRLRVRASDQVLDECDMQVIVANSSDRPLDNASMWDQLKLGCDRASLGTDKLILVCTHTDVSLPEQAADHDRS